MALKSLVVSWLLLLFCIGEASEVVNYNNLKKTDEIYATLCNSQVTTFSEVEEKNQKLLWAALSIKLFLEVLSSGRNDLLAKSDAFSLMGRGLMLLNTSDIWENVLSYKLADLATSVVSGLASGCDDAWIEAVTSCEGFEPETLNPLIEELEKSAGVKSDEASNLSPDGKEAD